MSVGSIGSARGGGGEVGVQTFEQIAKEGQLAVVQAADDMADLVAMDKQNALHQFSSLRRKAELDATAVIGGGGVANEAGFFEAADEGGDAGWLDEQALAEFDQAEAVGAAFLLGAGEDAQDGPLGLAQAKLQEIRAHDALNQPEQAQDAAISGFRRATVLARGRGDGDGIHKVKMLAT